MYFRPSQCHVLWAIHVRQKMFCLHNNKRYNYASWSVAYIGLRAWLVNYTIESGPYHPPIGTISVKMPGPYIQY